jgi:hypothetical protein
LEIKMATKTPVSHTHRPKDSASYAAPRLISGVQIPVVRNIEEAAAVCHEYKSVISAGPNERECDWGHKNHRVFKFGDTTIKSPSAPQYEQINDLVLWGAEQDDLLVHCHAGMSRSTSTAWGIAIARGLDPEMAIQELLAQHPFDTFIGRKQIRPFIPNLLVVKYLEEMFDLDLLEILNDYQNWN